MYFKSIFFPLDSLELLTSNQYGLCENHTVGVAGKNYIQLQRIKTNVLFKPAEVIDLLTERRSFKSPIIVDNQSVNNDYISVHIRIGADVFETEEDRFSHLRNNESLIEVNRRFIQCIERTKSKYEGSAKVRKIFLASDSLALKDIFAQELGKHNEKNGLSYNKSCYHRLGFGRAIHPFVVHTNRGFTWHLDNGRSGLFGNDTDHCLAFLDIFADAYAISIAETVLYFKSNFSEVAIGMGNVSSWYKLENSQEPLNEDDCFESTMATVENLKYGLLW